jgi:hypothetical protein
MIDYQFQRFILNQKRMGICGVSGGSGSRIISILQSNVFWCDPRLPKIRLEESVDDLNYIWMIHNDEDFLPLLYPFGLYSSDWIHFTDKSQGLNVRWRNEWKMREKSLFEDKYTCLFATTDS